MDGNGIKKMLEVQGKEIKIYMDKIMEFQAIHPDATKEDASFYLSGFKKDSQGLVKQQSNQEAQKKLKND